MDCIYIDPPYNTGAKDWKYNNDYVDSSDAYRHSKWLSMMEKHLKLAKKLLNPDDSVLIVTIDEKEYLHLGCLLEEIFPEARIQMASSMINPANVARVGEFGRSGEYIFFVMLGSSSPQRVKLSREWVSSKGRTHTGNVRWDLLKRSGTNSERKHSPGGFYPIYINNRNGKIEKVGEPLPASTSEAPPLEGCTALLPIRSNGSEGNWQWAPGTFKQRMEQGRVRIGGNEKKGFTVYILKDGEYSKIVNGEFNVINTGINGELICEDNDSDYVMAVPGDIWKISSHDATQYGSRMIGNIFRDRRFTFPKSLYIPQKDHHIVRVPDLAAHDHIADPSFLPIQNDAAILAQLGLKPLQFFGDVGAVVEIRDLLFVLFDHIVVHKEFDQLVPCLALLKGRHQGGLTLKVSKVFCSRFT